MLSFASQELNRASGLPGVLPDSVERKRPHFATVVAEVTMKPTMLNINKAKSLLRAMADIAEWKLGVAADPDAASRKHALGISGDELRDIEGYMAAQGWLDLAVGPGGVRTLTQAGIEVAQKVRP